MNGHPFTTSTGGSMSASALTAVVFPEPFGPRIRTPPIFGSTALIIRANFSFSRPTMAVNGNTTLLPRLKALPRFFTVP